jgi:hypothetical protein
VSDQTVPREAAERLRALLAVTLPHVALDSPELLTGLLAVVETEVERAVRDRCWKWLRKAGKPCNS